MNRREHTERADFLDRTIPLQGASHADAVCYSVDIPMRYAECVAMLKDGRRVRLQDSRQFMGWSGRDENRSLLFRSGGRRIVIDTRGESQRAEWDGVHKFIARDGSLLFVRRWSQELASDIGHRMRTFNMPATAAI